MPARFILLGHPRSGTNLMLWALREHPQVEMFGEIFHSARVDARAALPPPLPSYRLGTDGAAFLAAAVFPGQPARAGKRARGFKLFHDHARSDNAGRTAWRALIADPGIRVVHLVRHNLLDCRISLEIALRSGTWHQDAAGQAAAPPAPFALSPADCEWYFATTLAARQWATAVFAGHPSLTLDYDDDLCGDFAGAMARVFAFLDVDPLAVAPRLQRQRQLPASRQLSNFAELRDRFDCTLFETYFAAADAE